VGGGDSCPHMRAPPIAPESRAQANQNLVEWASAEVSEGSGRTGSGLALFGVPDPGGRAIFYTSVRYSFRFRQR
jgi:hypothetical protein